MISRRGVLGGLSTASVGCLAGCSALLENDPPAGSVQFTNDDDLPHTLSLWVTGVGSKKEGIGEVEGKVDVPEEQRHQTLSAPLQPGEVNTYQSGFTEDVYYELNFRIDGHLPQTLGPKARETFKPLTRKGTGGWYIWATVDSRGELSPGSASTSNEGTFTFNES